MERKRAFATCLAFMSVVMPALCIVLIFIGIPKLEVETSMDDVWTSTGSAFAYDKAWQKDHADPSGGKSMFLAIAKSRDGGNMLTPSNMQELHARIKAVTNTPIVVDGSEFTWEDVCVQLIHPYIFPCWRMTALDCYEEGNFDYTSDHAITWRDMMMNEHITPKLTEYQARMFPPKTLIYVGLAATEDACQSDCEELKLPIEQGMPPWILHPSGDGTWEEKEVCRECVKTSYLFMDQKMKADAYYEVIAAMWEGLPEETTQNSTIDMLKLRYWTPIEELAWDSLLKEIVKNTMTDELTLFQESGVGNTPYNFSNPFATTESPTGGRRKSLKTLDEAGVLARASKPCYQWDDGQYLPKQVKSLIFADTVPSVDEASEATPFSKVGAVQNVLPLTMPADIQRRVNLPYRPGGPMYIDMKLAEKVHQEAKKQFERIFSDDWDGSGNVQFTAWSDDIGSMGTTATMMEDMTIKAFRQAAIFYICITIVSMLFFIDFFDPLVQSRCILVFVGVVEVILGMSAAIAVTAMADVKIGIATSYTMPFILVGILCDDMYMLALSMDLVERAINPEMRWLGAMRRVAIPITVTSAVNLGVFAIIFGVSDLPAIYNIGLTGMVATFMLYLTLILSYAPIVYFDLLRRTAGKFELCCCCGRKSMRESRFSRQSINAEIRKSQSQQAIDGAEAPTADKAQFAANARRFKSGIFKEKEKLSYVFTRLYKPLMRSLAGRLIFIGVNFVLLVVGSCGLLTLEVGMEMQDMFPSDSQAFTFTENRMKLFPIYPTTIHWGGGISYRNSIMQMEMVSQYEGVLANPSIVKGVKTNSFWVAAFAEWGIDQPAPCKGRWKINVFGLKMRADGGYCYKNETDAGFICRDERGCCPVMEGFSDDQFAKCVEIWGKAMPTLIQTSPGMIFEETVDEFGVKSHVRPKMPIEHSQAGSNVVYAVNLWKTSDYTDLLRSTRKFADDMALHSWMSGNAYDYWEQYLELTDFLRLMAAVSCAAGGALSFIFIMAELTVNDFGFRFQRMFAAFVSACLIMCVMACSMTTVLGLCGLVGIQLNAFTAVSVLLASGFSIEYATHVVHHFLESQEIDHIDRSVKTMAFLFVPTAMSFFSSAISVIPLAFTGFNFVTKYFFVPLCFVIVVTYLYGSFALPMAMSLLKFMPLLEHGVAIKPEFVKPTRMVGDISPIREESPDRNNHLKTLDDFQKFLEDRPTPIVSKEEEEDPAVEKPPPPLAPVVEAGEGEGEV